MIEEAETVRRNDDLRAEYLILQAHYEAYDQRALSLKALATPLLGAGLAVGVKEQSHALLLATVLVAASLWLLEAIWKSFQYCFADRILLIESWYRGEGEEAPAPFQIYSAWCAAWGRYKRLSQLWPILGARFVFLPYLVVIVLAVLLLPFA